MFSYLPLILVTAFIKFSKSKEYFTLKQSDETPTPTGIITTISEYISRLNIRNTQTGVQFKNILTGTITRDLDIKGEVQKIIPVEPSDAKDFTSSLISYIITPEGMTMLTFTPDSDLKNYAVEKLDLPIIPQAAFLTPIKGSNRLVVGSLAEGESKLYRLDYSNPEEKVEIYANYKGNITSLHHITDTTMVIFTSSEDNLVFLVNAASIVVERRLRDLSFTNVNDSAHPEFSVEKNLILAKDSKFVLGMNYVSSETYFVLEFQKNVDLMKPVNNTIYSCFVLGSSTMKLVDLQAAFEEGVSGKNLVDYSPSFKTVNGDGILQIGVSQFHGIIQWVLNTSKIVDLTADSMIYCKQGCGNCTVRFSPSDCIECLDGFNLEKGDCLTNETSGLKKKTGFVENWDQVVWVFNEKKDGLIDNFLQNKSRILTVFIIIACFSTAALTAYLHFKNKKNPEVMKPSMEELDVLAGKSHPMSSKKLGDKNSKIEMKEEEEEEDSEGKLDAKKVISKEDFEENLQQRGRKKKSKVFSKKKFVKSKMGSKRSVRRGSRNMRKFVKGKSKMSKFVED